MQVELWPTDKLIPYARNARNISEENVSALAALIKEYGFRVPVIVDENRVIISGHVRLMAAKRLGMAEIPVHVASGLTPAQIKGLRLAENRVKQNTTWDFDLLKVELLELKDDFEFDLSLTGFDAHEIAPLLAIDTSEPPEDRGTASEEKPKLHTIKLTAEQHEVVGRAIFKVRQMENDDTISDGRALELVCADFLAS